MQSLQLQRTSSRWSRCRVIIIKQSFLYSFARSPGAYVVPSPEPISLTMSSTVLRIQKLPSSLASQRAPGTSASSFDLMPSASNALRRPNTCDSTCGPTPVCALRHEMPTSEVSVRPTRGVFFSGGSVNNAE